MTGATGNLGRAVVAALKAKGVNVRAAARNPGRVPRSAGVETVSFDYANPATHAAALQEANGGLDAGASEWCNSENAEQRERKQLITQSLKT